MSIENHIRIDKFFTGGAQHRVAELEGKPGRLIKVPHKKGRLWDRATHATVQTDIQRLIEAQIQLPGNIKIHGPSLVTDKEGGSNQYPYAIEMNWVDGRVFREIDLEDPVLKEQMSAALEASIQIRLRIGSAIDFLGGEAAKELFSYFRTSRPGQLGAYNFRVTQEGKLTLIDTNLLDPSRAPYLINPVVNTMIDLQHTLMAELIGSKGLRRDVHRSNHSQFVEASAWSIYQFSRGVEAVKRTFTQKEIPLG